MKIFWQCFGSYDSVKNKTKIIYLHEWYGQPFYWGIAKNSFFGGGKRSETSDSPSMSGRYNSGYRHWIEGCLRHGAKLYIVSLENKNDSELEALESYFIKKYPTEMNIKKKIMSEHFNFDHFEHCGDVPAFIRNELRKKVRPSNAN